VANVTELSGTPLPTMAIDYLTYQPSFQIARDKPDSNVSSDSGAGGNPSSPASGIPAPKRRIDFGPIVVGVVGGIIRFSLLGVCVRRKRRKDPAARKEFGARPFLSRYGCS
jgi:hypothetical protein